MTSLLKEIEQNINELIKLLLVEQAEFITAAEYDNGDDCLYDAPRVYTTSKHGYTNEWCVLRIDKGYLLYEVTNTKLKGSGAFVKKYKKPDVIITTVDLDKQEIMKIKNTRRKFNPSFFMRIIMDLVHFPPILIIYKIERNPRLYAIKGQKLDFVKMTD